MALTPGTRLGVYEITALLGEGGMGQVYRATDTKLKRQVAVKILPPAVAADAERLARFQREAEVLASLNHPNIAAIYGLEESGGVTALVMELVEGEDLSQRIARGAIPLDEALPIAKQIAEALEAAHEQGIIHRDLKPANIKVRADGTVKVLDFGLAKAMESMVGSSPSMSATPTITSPAMMTGVGALLGTAAYMSPEQARGKAVDKRADIWAFGAVCYEMLTGRRAFEGEGVSETLARVIEREPEYNRLPATLSPPLRTYLERCLQKDPRQRLRDIGDVRLALEGAFDTTAPKTTATSNGGRLAWVATLGVAVLGMIALAVPTVRHLREMPPQDTPEMRVEIVAPSTSDPGSFALSPDGRYLAFVGESAGGSSSLWLRSLEQVTTRILPGTEGAALPFWSPDSQAIGFFAGGKLKRVDMRGGMPRTLADAAPGFGAAWNAQGVILFASTSSTPLLRVPENGGEPVAQTKLDPPRQIGHGYPMFLPGGREFLFYARGTSEGQGVYLGSLDAPETRRLISVDRPPVAYVSPGGFRTPDYWLLYMQQETLMARRLEPTTKAFAGEPVAIADSLAVTAISTAYAPGAFSATPSGLVAYRTGGAVPTQLTWFTRSGQAVGTFGARDEIGLYNPEISPDGRQVAVRRTVENNSDIFLMDGARTVRRTFDAGYDQYSVWSPDGTWLAFSSQRKGVADLYRKRANGSGSDELLWESPYQKNVDDWSPDGRFLLYNEEDPVTLRNLWVLPLSGGGKPSVFLKTNFQEHRGQFSPDGRFVAYVSNEPGQQEIFVRPFPSSDNQWQISTGGGVQPRWSHDGKELYYVAPDGKLMATTIVEKDGAIEAGTPKALFQTRIPGGGTSAYTRPEFDVSSDGRFLVDTLTDDAGTSPVTLLLHWNPETKR